MQPQRDYSNPRAGAGKARSVRLLDAVEDRMTSQPPINQPSLNLSSDRRNSVPAAAEVVSGITAWQA
ncbi:MAG: hypothetical protein DMF20_10295 [Verrucomicrobia bacterium]|nr:MAG: hypothetical protein DMF20_10295 [Verrucomicrobiota bacterium]